MSNFVHKFSIPDFSFVKKCETVNTNEELDSVDDDQIPNDHIYLVNKIVLGCLFFLVINDWEVFIK